MAAATQERTLVAHLRFFVYRFITFHQTTTDDLSHTAAASRGYLAGLCVATAILPEAAAAAREEWTRHERKTEGSKGEDRRRS